MSLHCALCRDNFPRERVGDRFVHRVPIGMTGDRRRDGKGDFPCEAECLAVNDDQPKKVA